MEQNEGWGVVVRGGDQALRNISMLARKSDGSFTTEERAVGLVLTHASFFGSAQAVAESAEQLVAQINGLCLASGLATTVTTGPLIDLQGNQTVLVGTGELTLPSFSAGHVPQRHIQLAAAGTHGPVAEALRYFAAARSSPERAWYELYKVFETFNNDLRAEGGAVGAGLMSSSSAKLFKRTANSMNTSTRDGARHSDQVAPPPHPMTLVNARQEIGVLLRKWLAVCDEKIGSV